MCPPLPAKLYSTTTLMPGTARQVVGSRETALETVLVLRQVVTKARFQNINQLVEIIRSVGQKLIEAQPKGAPQTSCLCSSRRILNDRRAYSWEYCPQVAPSRSRGVQQCVQGRGDDIREHILHRELCAAGSAAPTGRGAKGRIDARAERGRRGRSRLVCPHAEARRDGGDPGYPRRT
jgi:hypothetical protein